MSNSVRDSGLLAEERVTLEPYHDNEIKLQAGEIDATSIHRKNGLGTDGSEVEGAMLLHSITEGKERANFYT